DRHGGGIAGLVEAVDLVQHHERRRGGGGGAQELPARHAVTLRLPGRLLGDQLLRQALLLRRFRRKAFEIRNGRGGEGNDYLLVFEWTPHATPPGAKSISGVAWESLGGPRTNRPLRRVFWPLEQTTRRIPKRPGGRGTAGRPGWRTARPKGDW